MLNLVCYISLCVDLRAGAGSLSYIVHVNCCGLSTIVIKTIIIIIIIIIIIHTTSKLVDTLSCEILPSGYESYSLLGDVAICLRYTGPSDDHSTANLLLSAAVKES